MQKLEGKYLRTCCRGIRHLSRIYQMANQVVNRGFPHCSSMKLFSLNLMNH